MPRFWRPGALLCLAIAGCGGRSLEGEWEGKVTGFGDECRLRFAGGSRVSVRCTDAPERAGLGSYRLEGTLLTIEWRLLREGLRTMPLPNEFLRARIEGPGNEIVVRPLAGGPQTTWRRRAP